MAASESVQHPLANQGCSSRWQSVIGELRLNATSLDSIIGLLDAAEVILPLSDSLRGLEELVQQPNLQAMAARSVARMNAELTSPGDLLTIDQAAAIHLYSIDSNFSVRLDKALREHDVPLLSRFRPYLRLLVGGLSKLPRVPCTVFAGVGQSSLGLADRLLTEYEALAMSKQPAVWWAPAIVSTDPSQVVSAASTTLSAIRYVIESDSAVDIRRFSSRASPKEVLLLPGTRFEVSGVQHSDHHQMVIRLREIGQPLCLQSAAASFSFSSSSSASASAGFAGSIQLSASSSSSAALSIECDMCSERAEFDCQQCAKNLCRSCDRQLHEISDKMRKHTRRSLHPTCANCDDGKTPATVVCASCEQPMLCSNCDVLVHKVKAFRDHQRQPYVHAAAHSGSAGSAASAAAVASGCADAFAPGSLQQDFPVPSPPELPIVSQAPPVIAPSSGALAPATLQLFDAYSQSYWYALASAQAHQAQMQLFSSAYGQSQAQMPYFAPFPSIPPVSPAAFVNIPVAPGISSAPVSLPPQPSAVIESFVQPVMPVPFAKSNQRCREIADSAQLTVAELLEQIKARGAVSSDPDELQFDVEHVLDVLRACDSHSVDILITACMTFVDMIRVNACGSIIKEFFGASNGIETLLQMQRLYLSEESLQVAAFGALTAIVEENEINQSKCGASAIDLILAGMREHPQSLQLNCAASLLLTWLPLRQGFFDLNGVELLVANASKHTESKIFMKLACDVLGKACANNSSNQHLIGSVGGIEFILLTVRSCAESAKKDQDETSEAALQSACHALHSLVVQHAFNQDCVRASGGITLLQNLIRSRSQPQASMLPSSVCDCLVILVGGRLAEAQEAFTLMFKLMQGRLKSASVQAQALSALTALLTTNKVSVGDLSVLAARIKMIVEIMNTHPQSSEVQSFACSTLALTPSTSHNQSLLCSQVAIGPIIKLMQKFVSNSMVQSSACRLLAVLLCGNESNLAKFLSFRGFDVLESSLTHHPESIDVHKQVLLLLKHTKSWQDEIKIVVLILDAMTRFSKNLPFQRVACLLINSVQSFKAVEIESQIIDCFFELAYFHLESTEVQIEIMRFMCLSIERDRADLVHRDRVGQRGIFVSLAALSAHPHSVGVQDWGCRLLQHCVQVKITSQDVLHQKSESSQKIFFEQNGVEIVMAALRNHADSSRVQQQALSAMRHATFQNSFLRSLFVNDGGITVVLDAMQRHPDCIEVQIAACTALQNFAHQNEVNQTDIGIQGGIELILSSMKRFSTAEDMQGYGWRSLFRICLDHTNNLKIVRPSAVQSQLRSSLRVLRNMFADIPRQNNPLLFETSKKA